MQKRKRVDWDAEIRRTENIQRKGLLMSVLSFAVAALFIFGMSRYTSSSIELPRSVLVAVLFCVSFVVFRVIMRKRRRKQ